MTLTNQEQRKGYAADVALAAEVAVEKIQEYPEDYPDAHQAVESAIQGDSRFTNYGESLLTVLISGQNPDQPDYCEPWTTYTDVSAFNHRADRERPTWSDCVGSMARVCYYSDVVARVTEPPGLWHEASDQPIQAPDDGQASVLWAEAWERNTAGSEARVSVWDRRDVEVDPPEAERFLIKREGVEAGQDTVKSAPTLEAARAVAVRLMHDA